MRNTRSIFRTTGHFHRWIELTLMRGGDMRENLGKYWRGKHEWGVVM